MVISIAFLVFVRNLVLKRSIAITRHAPSRMSIAFN